MKLQTDLPDTDFKDWVKRELDNQSVTLQKIQLLLQTFISDEELLAKVELEFLKRKDLQ